MTARILLHLAALAMPAGRGDWLRAMVHEFPHVPAAERLAFARGCLFASLLERIRPMTATPPLRIVPGLFGAALLTVLCVANGARLFAVDPVVGSFLLLAAVLWLAVLVTVQLQSAHRLARLAVVGALLYGALGALSLAALPAFVENAAMLRALALEGLVLFAVAFAVSQVPWFWTVNEKGSAA